MSQEEQTVLATVPEETEIIEDKIISDDDSEETLMTMKKSKKSKKLKKLK